MIRILFLSILCLIPGLLSAQLVNIESKRMQTDSVRFALNGDFSFNHTNNDGNQVNQIDAAFTTQLKSKDLRKIYFLLGNYRLIDTGKKIYRMPGFFTAGLTISLISYRY